MGFIPNSSITMGYRTEVAWPLWLVLLVCLTASPVKADCPPLTRSGLDAYLKQHGPLKVHFFASWCVECARHIREAPSRGVIFIATFDERPSAEKVYAKLGGKAPCFTDDGIADALGVKAVPTVRNLAP